MPSRNFFENSASILANYFKIVAFFSFFLSTIFVQMLFIKIVCRYVLSVLYLR